MVGHLVGVESRLDYIEPIRVTGEVSRVVGLAVHCEHFKAPIGATCAIHNSASGFKTIEAEVVGFEGKSAILVPYGSTRGVSPGDRVSVTSLAQTASVSQTLRGRVLDGRGRPIDGGEEIFPEAYYPIFKTGPGALARVRVSEPLSTGIRAMDSFLTAGKGQRLGIFSGSGVGKSMLLGMIARGTSADVTVIALVGERGREVRDFLERDLGPEGLSRAVVVVATSDAPPLVRVRAPFVASAIAEYFRDCGMDVLLLMDSLTRVALAQREVGLSGGEPVATKGFPPSVFALLPRLLERSGRTEKGSITAFYNVLVEADDMNEPISDACRGILDGHIWLNRDLATRRHYPAIDIIDSISRSMADVISEEHQKSASELARLMSVYRDTEDLINIGAYNIGTNPDIDNAIRMRPKINKFLIQDLFEVTQYEQVLQALSELAADAGNPPQGAAQ